MPRLFVALPVPEEIADDLLALQSGVPDARWIAPENFHVTLCFAGAVHGAVMRDLEDELADIASPRFAVALAGVEQFSSGKQPRALVATVERSDRLAWLQQKVSTVARNCGIEVERRKFRPHVTLAYLNRPAPARVAAWIQGHNLLKSPPFVVTSFGLYSSWLGDQASSYRLERSYRLDGG